MAQQLRDNSLARNSAGKGVKRMQPTSHTNVKVQDGKFYVRCREKGLKIDGLLLTATNEDQAIQEFLSLKKKLESNPFAKSRNTKVSIIVPEYIAYERKRKDLAMISEATFYEKEVTWRVYLLPFYGEKKMNQVTNQGLWMEFMAQEKRVSQFKNMRKVFVNFLNWAKDPQNGGYLDYVPDFDIPPHRPREGRDLPPQEVAQVYHSFGDPDSKDLWELLLISGRRKMEVVEADRKQFDFNRKTFLTKDYESKTKRPVLVPVSDRFLEICRNRFLKSNSNKLFPHPDDSTQPCNASYFKNRLEIAVARAGLNDIQWKDLRTTFANYVSRIGVEKDIQVDYLGHSEEINRANYHNKRIDEMRTVANAIDSRKMLNTPEPVLTGNVVSLFRR